MIKNLLKNKNLLHYILQEDYNEDSPKKRYTIGENFVYQFGIDPHPIHINYIKNSVDVNVVYNCKIGKSIRNNYLPYLEEVPINKIFSDTETFDVKKNTKEKKANIRLYYIIC